MAQRACTFTPKTAQTASLRYLLHLPEGYGSEADKRWPLILFLHGIGERGDDLNLVKKHGIPRIVEEWPGFPFIAASPQCPLDNSWSDHLPVLDGLIEEVASTYAVDRDRIYLTGLSMGGYGAWHLAMTYPQRFAALAPICGGVSRVDGYAERLLALKEMPIWVLHGAQDDIVPLHESQIAVEILQASGADVRFTIYPDAGHDSWTQTYSNPELYAWLLSHSRESG